MGDAEAQASQRRCVDESHSAWLSYVLAEVRASLRSEMQAEMQRLRNELAAVSLSDPPIRSCPDTPHGTCW